MANNNPTKLIVDSHPLLPCPYCNGSGTQFIGQDKDKPRYMLDCLICNGTGKKQLIRFEDVESK